jgi:phage terminase large subunit-like protein
VDKNHVLIARKYARDVVAGKISACTWTRKACQRQLDDLERKDWPFRFDVRKASRVCCFIEKLPHIKGEWAKGGQKIELQPWQIFILTTVFGWVSKETGLRRFRIAYIEVPRKNGKSTFSSGVALYCLVADGESGAEVYSAATTRDQAKIVWQDAKAMVDRTPNLQSAFGVSTTAFAIVQLGTGSSFKALSAEGETLDGLNIHCAIIDELHAHPTRRVYDVIETATGSRSQPLVWNITTAGSNRSGICYEIRGYACKVLDGVSPDETFFGIVYTLDEEDDWTNLATWAKANPNYGISVKPDDIARLCDKAKSLPSAQNNFLTKRLSVWVNADIALFSSAGWEKCKDEKLTEEDFIGAPCWVGIDLAPRHDFCAVAKVFRRDLEDGVHFYVFTRHYLSEVEVEESTNAQYQGWAMQEWIKTNPGNVTDYGVIEEDLQIDSNSYQLQEVCYDKFSAHQFSTRMMEAGFPMVEVGATVANFSEPTKKLEALIAEGKIHHNGDPVLAWEISNVVGHYDRKDNVFPVKERPENKIDGVIALIMALNRAMIGESSGSVYDIGPDGKSEEVWI